MNQNQMLAAEVTRLQKEIAALKAAQVKAEPVKVDPAIKATEVISQAAKVYQAVCELARNDAKNPQTGYYKSFTGGVIIRKAILKYGTYQAKTELQTAQTILKAAKEYQLI